jgi:excisionase family DNA binding protein
VSPVDIHSPWWTVDQAAAYARVHKSLLYRECAARRLEHVCAGGRRKILLKVEWVDAWLELQRVHITVAGGVQ